MLPTERDNVKVQNETGDLYRYFDATQQAEFLYDCIDSTIKHTLPNEVQYLKRYDEMKTFITNHIELPDRLVDLIIRFLEQGDGKLSKHAREKEFNLLTADELTLLENKYKEINS